MTQHWCLVLSYNNLALTQQAIKSLRAQDIAGGVHILVVDNGSTDATMAWLATQPDIWTIHNPSNGVARGWNLGLKWLFSPKWIDGRPAPPMADYCLVVNNDVVLRPDAMRHLVTDGGGFVTCVGKDDPECIKPMADGCYMDPDPLAKRPNPDFSAYLLRRWVWEQVGPFDECYEGAYVEDASYHLRMHQAEIRAEALELPFYHVGAATVKTASKAEQSRIRRQADVNRRLFREKWGVEAGSEAYYRLFNGEAPQP